MNCSCDSEALCVIVVLSQDNAPLDKNLSASNGSLSDNITTTKVVI